MYKDYCMLPSGEYCDISMKTSQYTPIKHQNFKRFIALSIEHWFFKRNTEEFYIIDTHTGSGIYPNGQYCMGMIFINEFSKLNINTKLYGKMCEINTVARNVLTDLIQLRGLDDDIKIYRDNKILLDYKSQSPGLIIYDPNGCMDIDYVNTILDNNPNMDIFIHSQPPNEQRRFWREDFVPLFKKIKALNRKSIYMTKKYGFYIDIIASNDISKECRYDREFKSIRSRYRLMNHIKYKWRKGRKYTTERFIKEAKAVHGDKYDYSSVNYIGMLDTVDIICPKHGMFSQLSFVHLNGNGCLQCGIEKRRLTTERFIEKARNIHGDKYDYSISKSTGYNNKVDIICPKHGIFSQKVDSHLTGNGCPQCSIEKRRLTTEIFIERATNIHDDKYDYSQVNYINATSKVDIICSKHGIFSQNPFVHLKGGGCPHCCRKKRKKIILNGSKKRRLTTEIFIERATNIHGDKYDYSISKCTGNESIVDIICSKHGIFSQKANYHLNGSGCPQCGIEKRRLTTEIFIERATNIHGDKYDYSQVNYINATSKVDIICSKHGIFSQRANSHLNGSGCPQCGIKRKRKDINGSKN